MYVIFNDQTVLKVYIYKCKSNKKKSHVLITGYMLGSVLGALYLVSNLILTTKL